MLAQYATLAYLLQCIEGEADWHTAGNPEMSKIYSAIDGARLFAEMLNERAEKFFE